MRWTVPGPDWSFFALKADKCRTTTIRITRRSSKGGTAAPNCPSCGASASFTMLRVWKGRNGIRFGLAFPGSASSRDLLFSRLPGESGCQRPKGRQLLDQTQSVQLHLHEPRCALDRIIVMRYAHSQMQPDRIRQKFQPVLSCLTEIIPSP